MHTGWCRKGDGHTGMQSTHRHSRAQNQTWNCDSAHREPECTLVMEIQPAQEVKSKRKRFYRFYCGRPGAQGALEQQGTERELPFFCTNCSEFLQKCLLLLPPELDKCQKSSTHVWWLLSTKTSLRSFTGCLIM